MEQWLNSPFTLRLKVFLFLLTGTAILLMAAAAFFISRDRLLLVLSGIIFFCCLLRSMGLLIVILRGDYETITGICTAVTQVSKNRAYRQPGSCCYLTFGETDKNKTGQSLLLLFPESLPPFPGQ